MPFAQADTVTVTLADLQTALDTAEDEPDAIRRMVLQRIQDRLDAADTSLQQGQLIFEQSLTDTVVEDGCNRTIIKRMQTRLILGEDSGIALTLHSLHDPVTLALNLSANLDAAGRARQIIGFRFEDCQDVAQDTFDFTARGPVAVAVQLTLNLNPEFITPTTLRLTPLFNIKSQLTRWDLRVDVDDSALRVLLERLLQSELEKAFGPEQIQSELGQLQNVVDELLGEAIPDGIIDIELPEPDDAQIIALYRLLQSDARFPLTLAHIRRYRHELLAALILGDDTAVSEIASDAVACQASDILQIPLTREPVYLNNTTGCTSADDQTLSPDQRPESVDRRIDVYSDAQCTTAIPFVSTDLNDFCEVALSAERLGNAAYDNTALAHWTLSPGNRFDIGSLSITNMQQPYMQRLAYKSVQTERGECQLEMRVYSAHPESSNKKPVLALHGGSWQYRGSGFLGIETTATQFVHSGFTVFAPFYRLLGTRDGNTECNNATLDQTLADAEDALQWVLDNSERFGAAGKPVVFGQSAGGHLAASLLVNRAEDVERGILLYAPLDFHDFASRIQQGLYTGYRGQRILEAITGQPVDEVDVNSVLIQENSFPSRIAAEPLSYPPVFLLHGQRDDLLPFRQSVRLCNAMSGNVESGPASLELIEDTAVRATNCDQRGSEFHLLREGEHALDMCIAPELCFAGSPEGRRAAEQVLERMFQWAGGTGEDTPPGQTAADDPDLPATGGSGGGAAALWFWSLLLLFHRTLVRSGICISAGLEAKLLN
ncbi:MAG: alpha/beta hydrolase [Gammaproteobacteria bacterium]|nr:alpha/beta hydrolase [Gammaproteobacteria bacterium]